MLCIVLHNSYAAYDLYLNGLIIVISTMISSAENSDFENTTFQIMKTQLNDIITTIYIQHCICLHTTEISIVTWLYFLC